MAPQVHVDHLADDELTYELELRGISPGPTTAKSRSNLKKILTKENKDNAPSRPPRPFPFEEDFSAVTNKREELKALLGSYASEPDIEKDRVIHAKFNHAIARIFSSIPKTAIERKQKNDLFTDLSAMFSGFQLGATDAFFDTTPVAQTAAVDSPSTSSFSCGADFKPAEVFASTPVTKPVPVAKWNLKFAADNRMSVGGFLERVTELSRARNVSQSQLFAEAIDLFEGKALIWFRANISTVNDWESLVRLLKAEFQPVNYDERLLEEIRRRTQGPNESIGIFAAILQNLFNRLTEPLSEHRKLQIILKNLTPTYQTHLALVEIPSIPALINLGRKIDERLIAIENFVPPTKRRSDMEPDLSYIEEKLEVCSLNSTAVNAISPPQFESTAITSRSRSDNKNCWNCGQDNHFASRCPQPRTKIFCFRCGAPDFTVNTCPKCRGTSRRNFSGNAQRRT